MHVQHINRFITAVLLSGCLFLSLSAHAGNCKKVQAELLEVQVFENCDSPNKFCAAGTIDGNQGLQGATFFSMDGGVLGPASSPGTIAYSGTFEIATEKGTLLLRESGVTKSRPNNPHGGIFSSFAEVLSGTGVYSAASGDVYFSGKSINGQFLVSMSGLLCNE